MNKREIDAEAAARSTPPPMGRVHLHFAFDGRRGRWIPAMKASPLCATVRCRPVLIRED